MRTTCLHCEKPFKKNEWKIQAKGTDDREFCSRYCLEQDRQPGEEKIKYKWVKHMTEDLIEA